LESSLSRQSSSAGGRPSADRKRKVFQHKSANNCSIANNSSTESSMERSISTCSQASGATITTNDSVVSRALEEALKATAILGWEASSSDLAEDVSASPPALMTPNALVENSIDYSADHKPVVRSLSKSSPCTANSSPKRRGKFCCIYYIHSPNVSLRSAISRKNSKTKSIFFANIWVV
jgi:hypothetical protein